MAKNLRAVAAGRITNEADIVVSPDL